MHGEVGGGTHRRAKTQPCVATRVRVDSNHLCTHSLRSTLKGERKAPPTNHHLWRRPRNPNGAWLALHFKLDSADPFMQDGWPSSCDNGSPKWNLETSGGLPTLRCRPTGGERGGGEESGGDGGMLIKPVSSLGSIHIRSIRISSRPRKNGENGGNGGKWGNMGENGKLLQIHHGKCMKMFQQERKTERNGVKWGRNGCKMGHDQATSAFFQVPFSPFFLKVTNFPTRPLIKKVRIQVPGGKMGKL